MREVSGLVILTFIKIEKTERGAGSFFVVGGWGWEEEMCLALNAVSVRS